MPFITGCRSRAGRSLQYSTGVSHRPVIFLPPSVSERMRKRRAFADKDLETTMLQRECQWSLMYAAQQQPQTPSGSETLTARSPGSLAALKAGVTMPKEFLQRLFPHHNTSALDMVLQSAGGDLHRAIEYLVTLKSLPPACGDLSSRSPLGIPHDNHAISPMYVPWCMPFRRLPQNGAADGHNAAAQRYADLLLANSGLMKKPRSTFQRSAFSPISPNGFPGHNISKVRCSSVEDDDELICVDDVTSESGDESSHHQHHVKHPRDYHVKNCEPPGFRNHLQPDVGIAGSKATSNSTPKLSFSVDFLLGQK